ncbi:MAG: MJ0042-type zinc finger domain-containing protein [Pseudomonadota bacterium]
MILTCPACSTKYVVKDGAIPPAGRQVRCASCKHSWHQDPEESAVQPSQADEGVPDPQPAPDPEIQVAESAAAIVEPPFFPTTDTPNPLDQIVADVQPRGVPPLTADRQWQRIEPASAWDDPVDPVEAPAPAPPQPEQPAEEFEPFYDHEPIEQLRRKWPLVLLLVIMVALAAIAFWFFAPAELRARAGLASAKESQLYAVVNTGDYQRLASGNNLFTVSGRIVNSTDSRQPVPPIRAELLDKSKQRVIHRWTISPPTNSLDINKSASFNSAEVDVPEGGEFIRIRLGGPA